MGKNSKRAGPSAAQPMQEQLDALESNFEARCAVQESNFEARFAVQAAQIKALEEDVLEGHVRRIHIATAEFAQHLLGKQPPAVPKAVPTVFTKLANCNDQRLLDLAADDLYTANEWAQCGDAVLHARNTKYARFQAPQDIYEEMRSARALVQKWPQLEASCEHALPFLRCMDKCLMHFRNIKLDPS